MSRSVETVGDNVIYFDVSDYEQWDWDDLITNLQVDLCRKYPSFNRPEKFVKYPYRENRIILENQFVSISISEYCGCAAISVFVRDDLNSYEWRDNTDLAEHWLKQCYPRIKKIIRQYVQSMVCIARASNGEAFFELEK